MHVGLVMECDYRTDVTQEEAFDEAFALAETADEFGLDGVWLAERHFAAPRRPGDPMGAGIPSVVSVPLVMALGHRRPHQAGAHRHRGQRPAPVPPGTAGRGSRHRGPGQPGAPGVWRGPQRFPPFLRWLRDTLRRKPRPLSGNPGRYPESLGRRPVLSRGGVL